MFGIGFSELVLIGLILIIFVKPEDLPNFFRSMGKLYRRLKGAYEDVISVKDKILKEIDEAVLLEDKTGDEETPGGADPKPPPESKPEPPPTAPPAPPSGSPKEENLTTNGTNLTNSGESNP
jgi:sec-independent protein translocase protein TatB